MISDAKSHGLDGSMVEPDWAPLSLDEVRRVLNEFPEAGEAVQVLSVSPRPFSAASVIETTRSRVFVKRHARSLRDREGLEEEHRFMDHLRPRVAVPHIFRTASGTSAFEQDPWVYEVHVVPPGIDLYRDAISWTPFRSTAHARAAGTMLARMHLASENFDAPPRKAQPLVASFTIFADRDPVSALDRYLAGRPSLDSDAETRTHSEAALALLEPFHSELAPHLPFFPSLWTHNDLHASNLFWSSDESDAYPTAVIDFGLADRTNAVHDLAHTIERSIVEWLALMHDPTSEVPVHLDHMTSLLEGYESIRPMTNEEAFALAPMTAVCHAEFALTEADYFLGVLHSDAKARVATNDYLLGHARWFRSPQGERLLAAIRQWAEKPERMAVRA